MTTDPSPPQGRLACKTRPQAEAAQGGREVLRRDEGLLLRQGPESQET